MSTYTNDCINISGKPLTLTCKRIGSASDGCQFIVKYKKDIKNKIFLSVLLPIFFILLRNLDCTFIIYFILTVCSLAFIESSSVRGERVMMIPFVGIQYTTEYGFKLETNNFIHWQAIDSVIINEVIHMQSVIYILTVILKDNSEKTSLVTLFKNTKPRLKCLEIIYQEMQTIFDNKK